MTKTIFTKSYNFARVAHCMWVLVSSIFAYTNALSLLKTIGPFLFVCLFLFFVYVFSNQKLMSNMVPRINLVADSHMNRPHSIELFDEWFQAVNL